MRGSADMAELKIVREGRWRFAAEGQICPPLNRRSPMDGKGEAVDYIFQIRNDAVRKVFRQDDPINIEDRSRR